MPFTKTGDNSYTSPSGRHFNGAQVRLYYANGGHFPGEKGYAQGGTVNKGYLSKTEGFAAGGPVLPRSRSWTKDEINNNRQADAKQNFGNMLDGQDRFTGINMADQGVPANEQRKKPDEDWGKGHVASRAVRSGDTKSEKPVKPRG